MPVVLVGTSAPTLGLCFAGTAIGLTSGGRPRSVPALPGHFLVLPKRTGCTRSVASLVRGNPCPVRVERRAAKEQPLALLSEAREFTGAHEVVDALARHPEVLRRRVRVEPRVFLGFRPERLRDDLSHLLLDERFEPFDLHLHRWPPRG